MKTLKTIGTSQKLAATVAVSGGVDSLVLLHWVAFHFGNQIDLYPVYVDHGQRADTERDWACVRTLCSRLPHLKSPTRIRIPKRDLLGSASEAQLRSLRYGVLERFSVSRNAPVVFTAHHADDVLETYLLKLLRGSHPTSLKGMAPKSRKGALWLVRPFLKLHKSELVQYALANRIKWHEDATNSSPKYARNRIRNELLPLIESLRPKSTKKLLTFFSDLEKLSSTLEEARTPSLGGGDQLSSPNGAPSLQLDFYELKSILNRYLGANSQKTTRGQWSTLERILQERKTTKSGGGPRKLVQFPGGGRVVFEGPRIRWEPSLNPANSSSKARNRKKVRSETIS